MGVKRSDSNSPVGRVPRWIHVAFALALVAPSICRAQEPPVPSQLPETRHLAAALSDPASRGDTLMTVVALLRLREFSRGAQPEPAERLVERFEEERAWLERLATRYDRLPTRSPVLDPAAWFLLQELDQFQQVPDAETSPLGPAPDHLMAQLFDRSNERVAATLLPEVLSRSESEATARWRDLLEAAPGDPQLLAALQELNDEWFEPWTAAEPPAPSAEAAVPAPLDHGALLLGELAAMATQAGPPDPLRLKRLRHGLHRALPALDGAAARDAGFLLTLASAVDGLYAGEYLPMTETLLWVVSDLLLEAQRRRQLEAVEAARVALAELEPPPPEFLPGDSGDEPAGEADEIAAAEAAPEVVQPPEPYVSPLPGVLAEWLPTLSSTFSPEFARVDPGIGAALATAFDAAQFFHAGQQDDERLRMLLSGTADAVARLVLLVPDMSYYFDQPVRRPVGSAIVDCIGVVAASAEPGAEPGAEPPSQEAVDRCTRGLGEVAADAIASAELAGDPDGPFGVEQLRRELLLAPWQRVNYVLGYLQEEVASECQLPDQPLPNPLEWSSLVTVLDWFARREPYRFRNGENRALLVGLREQGARLLAALAGQTECVASAAPAGQDPVRRSLDEYREALGRLIASLRETELAFRAERLEPGADVVLDGGAGQATAYRPEDLAIGPCEESRVCEMRATLPASPALLARFPAAYRVADQVRLGELEICYDNVQWVDRRAEPVRPDDPHVANYYGRLNFELVGRLREGEDARPVFGFNFTSPDEYHYLFGAATDEVLADGCPMEWVGTRIVTGLGGDSQVRVVPDRLTYLTAARSLPSRLLNANWARGQEWRAAFEAGAGVTPHDYPPDPALAERLNRQLKSLFDAEQATLYGALFTPPERTWRRRVESPHDRLAEVSAHKALIAAHVNLLYPQSMVDSDEIRGLLAGRGALIDERVLRQFRREGVPASEIDAGGTARLGRMVDEWNRVPESVRRGGSVAIGVAHALARLNALERDIFERLLPGEYAPLSFDDLDG